MTTKFIKFNAVLRLTVCLLDFTMPLCLNCSKMNYQFFKMTAVGKVLTTC